MAMCQSVRCLLQGKSLLMILYLTMKVFGELLPGFCFMTECHELPLSERQEQRIAQQSLLEIRG